MRIAFVKHLCLSLCLGLVSLSALADKPKILVLGDSLSAGYNIPIERAWASLLQQRLPEFHWVNASVSGITTTQGLDMLPKLLQTHQPRWLLLELGANDGLRGKPVPQIRDNLKKLIQLSTAAGTQVLLIGIRLPPNLGKRYTDSFYGLYEQLASELGVPRVPFLLEGVAGNPALMQTDGLHPTAEAQPMIMETVWQHWAPLVQSQKATP
jgi:acyl-CoA thioesterase I